MKKFCIFLLLAITFSCCTNKSNQNEINKLSAINDSLIKRIDILNKRIIELYDSLSILSFPSDQRYLEILKLIQEDNLDVALEKIDNLKKIFPHSSEANKVSNQISIIEKKKAAKKAEEERKSRGFKL